MRDWRRRRMQQPTHTLEEDELEEEELEEEESEDKTTTNQREDR